MKQVLLSIMMLLCVGNAFGQTSAKLIEKYKALPVRRGIPSCLPMKSPN
ncbi:hypothetical protein [uncultured Prevotella sp.]|nr:hypothetical protein [uncultured Prevotella sp.]